MRGVRCPILITWDCAREIAVRYVNEIGEREVMPNESTLAELATLREAMPANANDPFAVIRQLGELGGVVVALGQRAEHGHAGNPEDVGGYAGQLNVGALQ